jgi:hypothetical protein
MVTHSVRDSDSWNALYISNIPSNVFVFNEGNTMAEPFTGERLKRMIEEYCYLGKVSRIDYVQIPGHNREAFIHFTSWNKHLIVDIFREIMDTDGSIEFTDMDEWTNGNVKDNSKFQFGIFQNGVKCTFPIIFTPVQIESK